MAIGKSVESIFDLMHHFVNAEDQISANFGLIPSTNKRTILMDFLGQLGIDNRKMKPKDVERIETQISYPLDGQRSIIDLHIKLDSRFLIFIELKLGESKLSEEQMKK
jgi:hypothetical protein